MPAINLCMYIPTAVPLWCEKTNNITSINGIESAVPIGTSPNTAAGQPKPAALDEPIYYMNPEQNRIMAYIYIPTEYELSKYNNTQNYLMYVWNSSSMSWTIWNYADYFRKLSDTVTSNGVTYDIYELAWYDEDYPGAQGWSSNFCFNLTQKS